MSGRELLIEYQRQSKLSQTELATRFGVTSAYVSMLLSGDRVVTRLDVAARIERATGGAVPAMSWDGAKRIARRRRAR